MINYTPKKLKCQMEFFVYYGFKHTSPVREEFEYNTGS